MLTDKDITKLRSLFATKVDFRHLEGEIKGVRETFEGQIIEVRDIQQQILQAVDGLLTPIEKLRLEYAAVSEQTSRHDRWIKRIAKKSEVSLKE